MQIAKSSVHPPRSRQRPSGGPHRHKHACNALSQAPTSAGVRGLRGLSADRLLRRAHLRWQRSKRGGTAVRWTQSSEAGAGLRWGQRQYRVLHISRPHPPPRSERGGDAPPQENGQLACLWLAADAAQM